MEMYQLLYERFGPQHWWPGDTPFEVMVGAVLTQNTNWTNVEKAIKNLKSTGRFSVKGLLDMPEETLAALIRPAGYYNLKTKRLRNLLEMIMRDYDGRLEAFFDEDTSTMREKLLSIKGIGPETADSIILYAAERPIFVVDAYTYRILSRHEMVTDDMSYEDLQELFMSHLPEDVQLYNEFHALIVKTGKSFCRKTPLCENCPLQDWGPARYLPKYTEN
ncbi:MAG: endonuclease III domain-containing protein [Deltaproteobacteria bacterium]|nr:MAG: endonuclease III domain-containing protein [Deltaproteobacteria bacterium]